MMVGKGSISHNSRKFYASNIDPERTSSNICYCNDDLKMVYHQMFDEALERYNAKQTRADRRIDNYYEKISSGKQEKLFHEVIFQIGNKDDMAAVSEDGQLAVKVLDEFMRDFQGRNPNLCVFSAHLHMDEATPHLHIDFVPFTTGSKRGLDTRVSLKQALATQGFKGGSRGDTEWKQWVDSEKEQLSQVMERHGIEWEQLGTHNEHLSVLDFKKKERQSELEKLEKSISKINKQQLDIHALEKIEAKPIPLSSKVVLAQEDYQVLITAAQKYVAQEKKERRLQKLLNAANKKIAQLEKKVSELLKTIANMTRELNQYRSIREKLKIGNLQQENERLSKNNSFYKSIIEQHGLSHLLGSKKNQHKSQDIHR